MIYLFQTDRPKQKFVHIVDADEMAPNEPSHQDVH